MNIALRQAEITLQCLDGAVLPLLRAGERAGRCVWGTGGHGILMDESCRLCLSSAACVPPCLCAASLRKIPLLQVYVLHGHSSACVYECMKHKWHNELWVPRVIRVPQQGMLQLQSKAGVASQLSQTNPQCNGDCKPGGQIQHVCV